MGKPNLNDKTDAELADIVANGTDAEAIMK